MAKSFHQVGFLFEVVEEFLANHMGRQLLDGDGGASPFGSEYLGKGSLAYSRPKLQLRWIHLLKILREAPNESLLDQFV